MKQIFAKLQLLTSNGKLNSDVFIDSLGNLSCTPYEHKTLHVKRCTVSDHSLRALFVRFKKEVEHNLDHYRSDCEFGEIKSYHVSLFFNLGQFTLDDYPHECFLVKPSSKTLWALLPSSVITVKSELGDAVSVNFEDLLDYMSERLAAKTESARRLKL